MDSDLQTFLDRMAEVLEVPSVSPDDDFRAVPMWSSMVAFAVRVMFDLDYSRGLSGAELDGAKTVRDLAHLAGVLKA